MPNEFDFSGWATRNDIRCADGRTIKKNAFKDCDGKTVPLVWSHRHDSNEYVIGHALLENRDEGVYTYGTFNGTELGKKAREQVRNGDITSLSIFANHLTQDEGKNVLHGMIREVSLVLAGANPGAYIDYCMAHEDGSNEGLSATIFNPIENLELAHACGEDDSDSKKKLEHAKEGTEMPTEDKKDITVEDVINSMNEDQQVVVQALAEKINELQTKLDEQTAKHSDDANQNEDPGTDPENNTAAHADNEEDNTMAHNIFEGTTTENKEDVLTHEEEMAIFADARKSNIGNLRDACLAHSITNIGYLYPDYKNVDREPKFITRKMEWVDVIMKGVHHTPFSRIRSVFANLTADEARAKGYLTKGTQKIEEVISLLRRTTDPTTIYKLQKFDRDDVLDITDFDVVAWIKTEMRFMLDEEIARAILIGDGRSAVANDKIDESKVRPIWTDDDLFVVHSKIVWDANDTDTVKTKKFIHACVRARKNYKGSGNPILFTTEDQLTDCLLMEDTNGRVIYDTIEKLATALRVSKIVTVPVMENKTRLGAVGGAEAGLSFDLFGIIVNPSDYNVGADKGGSVNMFDDFNIDYNKYEYLIETRCSGALTMPYSAIVVERQYETPSAIG